MKQERINDNKVRFILDRQDLEERNLEITDLSYGSPGAKELFDELMQLAKEEMGLDEGAHPMMVEAIPMAGSGLVVNISRVMDNPDELDPRFSRFTNGLEYDTVSDQEMDGPGFDDEYGEPESEGQDGPGSEDNGPGGLIPDGIQIQQGPEIRAEINIPRSASIDPKDIMSVIDNIMSGLAGKLNGGEGSGKQPKEPAGAAVKKPAEENNEVDGFAVYEFRDLQSVIRAARLLNHNYHSKSILYKNPVNRKYYLYLGREHNTIPEFAGAISLLNEFGSRCRITYASKEYFDEHMEKLLDDALIHLDEL